MLIFKNSSLPNQYFNWMSLKKCTSFIYKKRKRHKQNGIQGIIFKKWPQGASHGGSEKPGKLEVGGDSRDSTGLGALEEGLSPVEAGTAGYLWFQTPFAGSLQTGDRRVRPRLGLRHGTPLASRDVPGERGRLSSCLWNGQYPLTLWRAERSSGPCQRLT